jgi:hypothetical protein
VWLRWLIECPRVPLECPWVHLERLWSHLECPWGHYGCTLGAYEGPWCLAVLGIEQKVQGTVRVIRGHMCGSVGSLSAHECPLSAHGCTLSDCGRTLSARGVITGAHWVPTRGHGALQFWGAIVQRHPLGPSTARICASGIPCANCPDASFGRKNCALQTRL